MRRPAAEALRDATDRLKPISDSPRLEARLLLAHAPGLTVNDLIRRPSAPVDTARFEALLGRRLAREPLALILGHQPFWTLEFEVSSATLIPRSDSETVVRAALGCVASPPRSILDLGTGTGCLLLALLSEWPEAFGIGVDRLAAAAALARRNAAHNGLIDRSAFAVSNWTDAITGVFDLVISNPYIKTTDIPMLMPEVAMFEPATALDGGCDGLDAYRTIIGRLPDVMHRHGRAVLELGAGQAADVGAIAAKAGFHATLHQDLAGIERAIVLSRLIG